MKKFIIVSLIFINSACANYDQTGPRGAPGGNCTVSNVTGGSLVSCPDGTQTFVSNGLIGPVGPAGSPGTLLTPVQFCPNVTPNYPSTFPEYGFCIEGKLYGVYSTNGGFLALLPDGTYNSNAVGSSCTFTITGCTVN